MKYAYRFTSTAEADLIELAKYIARDSEDAARRLITNTHKTIEYLCDFPLSREVEKAGGIEPLGLRSAMIEGFKNHLIVYSFDGVTVTIEYAFHAAQNWAAAIAKGDLA